MSQATRERKRRNDKRRKTLIVAALFLIAVFILLGVWRNMQRVLVETSEYTTSYSTDLFFFKDIDYIYLDDFQAGDLTLKEGDKTNGYTALTQSPKVVNADYLSQQQAIIDSALSAQSYNNWSEFAMNIIANYQEKSFFSRQLTAKEGTLLSADAVQYIGMTEQDLQNKKNLYSELADGQPRTIALSDLSMLSTGYVYASVSDREKMLSEDVLGYINAEFLKNAGKVNDKTETALKIVNNDHVFIAFSMPKEETVVDKDLVLENKNELIGTTGTEKNQAYYEELVRRVDQLVYYPTMAFDYGNNRYDAYFVDYAEDGDNQMIVLMLKDYVNIIANETVTNTTVYTEKFDCYKIPQSAIVKKDGQTYVKTVEKGYFEELIPVDVYTYQDGTAILKPDTENNSALSSSMTIKVYP